MPAVNYDALNAALAANKAAVEQAVTVDASAVTLIQGFSDTLKAEVIKALDADNAADQTTIDTVTAVFNTVTAAATDSSQKLGAAVLAATPQAPPALV